MNRIATTLALTVLLLAAAASAQTADSKIIARVPFDFVVGERTLPAGEYAFVRPGDHQLLVRDISGRNLLTVVTGTAQAAQPAPNTSLKFATINGQHVLVQIWTERDSSGSELYLVKAREAEKYSAVHSVSVGRR